MCVCHVCHAKWDSRLFFTFFGMQGQLNLVGLASDTKSCWRCEEIGWKTEAASFGRGHLAGRSEMGGLRTRNCDYVRHVYKETLTLRFLGCKSLKWSFPSYKVQQYWKQRDIKGTVCTGPKLSSRQQLAPWPCRAASGLTPESKHQCYNLHQNISPFSFQRPSSYNADMRADRSFARMFALAKSERKTPPALSQGLSQVGAGHKDSQNSNLIKRNMKKLSRTVS